MSRYTEVEGVVIRSTDDAVLIAVDADNDNEVWIPFSQIEDNGEEFDDGDEVLIYITEWIAEKKGLL